MSHSTLLKSISVGTNTLHKSTTLSKHGSVVTPTKAGTIYRMHDNIPAALCTLESKGHTSLP